MPILTFCKLWSLASLGSHFIAAPALLVVAGLTITPLGIGVSAVSVACFLIKHPGKPMTAEQWATWDETYRSHGLR